MRTPRTRSLFSHIELLLPIVLCGCGGSSAPAESTGDPTGDPGAQAGDGSTSPAATSTDPGATEPGAEAGPKNPDGGPGPSPTEGGPPPSPWNPPDETGAVTFPYTAYNCSYAIRQVSPSKPAATFHADAGTGAVQNLHLTFAGPASSSMVVSWSTDGATTASEVRFGSAPTTLDKTAHGFSFTYGVSGRRQHEVHICGLEAGRTYYYDAGGKGARSKGHSFTTAPNGPTEVKVLVTGDARDTPSVMGSFASKALAAGPTLMLFTGDAVATGGTQSQWDAFFAAAPELFASLPMLAVNGNHENNDEVYYAQFALPDNGGASGIEQWFDVTYGPLRILALNDTVATASDISTAQANFLKSALGGLDRGKTPFVAAVHHQPFYSSTLMPGHVDTTTRGAWAPIFDQYHVNLDIAGHVHAYESSKPMVGGTSSSEGTPTTDAKGTRYIYFGGAGAPTLGYNPLGGKAWDQKAESTQGYAIMTVNTTQIGWAAFRTDNTTIETITITK